MWRALAAVWDAFINLILLVCTLRPFTVQRYCYGYLQYGDLSSGLSLSRLREGAIRRHVRSWAHQIEDRVIKVG